MIAETYRERCAEDSDIAAHLPYLHDTVVRLQAKAVVELGTRYGNSTSALLAGVTETGGHLWSIDPRPMTPDTYRDAPWTLIAQSDMEPYVVDLVPARLDVLFIDTSHTYAHTFAELMIYGERVRPGGVILAHDTEFTMDGEDGFPVARALDFYCRMNGLAWVNRPGSFGLGVLEIPEDYTP